MADTLGRAEWTATQDSQKVNRFFKITLHRMLICSISNLQQRLVTCSSQKSLEITQNIFFNGAQKHHSHLHDDVTQIFDISLHCYKHLKRPRHDLSPTCTSFIFPFLKSRLVNIGILNAFSKLEVVSSYRRDTVFDILCFVNKVRVSLLFTCICFVFGISCNQMVLSFVDDIIYEHIEYDYLVCNQSFYHKILLTGFFFKIYIICKLL